MNLSQNFTLQELIYSDTANAYKINNTPSEPVINNLKALSMLKLFNSVLFLPPV